MTEHANWGALTMNFLTDDKEVQCLFSLMEFEKILNFALNIIWEGVKLIQLGSFALMSSIEETTCSK